MSETMAAGPTDAAQRLFDDVFDDHLDRLRGLRIDLAYVDEMSRYLSVWAGILDKCAEQLTRVHDNLTVGKAKAFVLGDPGMVEAREVRTKLYDKLQEQERHVRRLAARLQTLAGSLQLVRQYRTSDERSAALMRLITAPLPVAPAAPTVPGTPAAPTYPLGGVPRPGGVQP